MHTMFFIHEWIINWKSLIHSWIRWFYSWIKNHRMYARSSDLMECLWSASAICCKATWPWLMNHDSRLMTRDSRLISDAYILTIKDSWCMTHDSRLTMLPERNSSGSSLDRSRIWKMRYLTNNYDCPVILQSRCSKMLIFFVIWEICDEHVDLRNASFKSLSEKGMEAK